MGIRELCRALQLKISSAWPYATQRMRRTVDLLSVSCESSNRAASKDTDAVLGSRQCDGNFLHPV